MIPVFFQNLLVLKNYLLLFIIFQTRKKKLMTL